MMRLEMVEQSGHSAEERRRGEQAQRMPGRRRVDDDGVEPPAFPGQPGHFEQADDLVDPRQRQLQEPRDVLVIKISAAQRDRGQQLAPRREPALERCGRVDVGGVQAPGLADERGRGADRGFEDRCEGRCGIGGDQEGAAPAGGFQRQDRGAGGLADPPFAADEVERQCSSPSNDASMPVTFMSFGEMTADSPPRWRALISRIRARMSVSS